MDALEELPKKIELFFVYSIDKLGVDFYDKVKMILPSYMKDFEYAIV